MATYLDNNSNVFAMPLNNISPSSFENSHYAHHFSRWHFLASMLRLRRISLGFSTASQFRTFRACLLVRLVSSITALSGDILRRSSMDACYFLGVLPMLIVSGWRISSSLWILSSSTSSKSPLSTLILFFAIFSSCFVFSKPTQVL